MKQQRQQDDINHCIKLGQAHWFTTVLIMLSQAHWFTTALIMLGQAHWFTTVLIMLGQAHWITTVFIMLGQAHWITTVLILKRAIDRTINTSHLTADEQAIHCTLTHYYVWFMWNDTQCSEPSLIVCGCVGSRH